jgi:hypothetical protein
VPRHGLRSSVASGDPYRKDWISGANGAVLGHFQGASRALRSCPAGVNPEVGLRWCGLCRIKRMKDLMTKSAKKPALNRPHGRASEGKPRSATRKTKTAKSATATSLLRGRAAQASENKDTTKSNRPNSATKQSRVLSMLQSGSGTTIEAMMQATGWQQHSVRGFLAGVVRKRLKLELTSKKVDGSRVYQIGGGGNAEAHSRPLKRRAA